MRAAPPVGVPSRSAGPWLRIQQVLHGASAAVAAWWVGAHWVEPGPGLLSASLALAAVAALAARRLAEAPAQLAWDGAAWSLRDEGGEARSGRPRLMLDLGAWMLVRFVPNAAGSRARWLPLSRRDAGAAWQGLRIALHAGPAA